MSSEDQPRSKQDLQNQAKVLGFNVEKIKFNSDYELYTFINKGVGPLPSLIEMHNGLTKFKLYETSKYLSKEIESLVQQKFQMCYVGTATQDSLSFFKIDSSASNDIDIEIEMIRKDNLPDSIQFIITNYYKQFPDDYSEKEIETFKKGAIPFFDSGAMGKLYKKQGKIVGCLFLCRMEKHHLISVPAIHIGYWGYDIKLTNKSESAFIKNDWIKSLKELAHPGDVFNVSSSCLNPAANKFVEKAGFKLVGIRLDPK